MTRCLPRSHALVTSFLVGLTLAPPVALAQQRTGRAFTPEDALDVRTARIQDVSDDGAWIAATVQRHRDRLNVDHERFGDPTYVSPSAQYGHTVLYSRALEILRSREAA